PLLCWNALIPYETARCIVAQARSAVNHSRISPLYVALKCEVPLIGLQPRTRRPISTPPNFIFGTWTFGLASDAGAAGVAATCPAGAGCGDSPVCGSLECAATAIPITPIVRPAPERRNSLRVLGIWAPPSAGDAPHPGCETSQ